ncbi:hypothetical protein COL516b_009689 [Colletotrichum fioriniae]|nr:uncharacterized protein COL516b_009689 [Colletotrichum fioriniae]KAJ0298605.1 hypothetical protein COL516b_009689 [Colletotrichum fioriniae]
MEHTLKCNVLKCRKELSDQALVTTCSIYQRYLEKTLTEKLKTLNVKFEKTVGDANADISGLQEKMRALSDDYDDMRRKHEELARSYQDKCRKLTQVQELYDKVKRKAELGQMEAAASDAVDSNLQYGTQLPAFEFPESAARQNIYEQQSQSAYNDAHSYVGPERGHRRPLTGGGGSAPLRDDRAWSKPGPAQGTPDTVNMRRNCTLTKCAGGFVSTPRGTPRGHGSDSHERFGLSTASGLGTGTGTPMPRGPSGNLPLARHPPISRGRGLGVGLSSGIRTGHTSHGSYGSTGRNDTEPYPYGISSGLGL